MLYFNILILNAIFFKHKTFYTKRFCSIFFNDDTYVLLIYYYIIISNESYTYIYNIDV